MAGLDREPRDSTDPRRSGGHLGDDKDLRTTSPPSPGGTALCESDEHRTPGEDVTGRGRHPGGRPLKLTPKLVDLMVALIERGNPPRRAARLLHLSAPTYHRWMKKGAARLGLAWCARGNGSCRLLQSATCSDSRRRRPKHLRGSNAWGSPGLPL